MTPMTFQTPDGSAAAMGGSPQVPSQPPLVAMKMKGLPFTVTQMEILTFFAGCNFDESSIKIGVMGDGRLTGEAVLLFHSADDCQNAQAKLDKQVIGSRWVKLIRIVTEEYNNFENEQTNKYDGGGYYDNSRRGGYGGGDFRGGRGAGRGRGGGRGSRGSYRGHEDMGGYNDRGYGGG